MNMSIFDRMKGYVPFHKNRVTKPYRHGRKYRIQQIVTREDDRPKVKTIIHQMF